MKTLEEFRNDIQRIFERAEYRGPKGDKDEHFVETHTFRKGTSKTYLSQVNAYANWVYEQYGVTDFHFLKPRYAEEYIQTKIDGSKTGKVAVSTIKTTIHGLAKYQNLLRDQFDCRVRVINKEKMLNILKDNNMIRELKNSRKGRIISREMAMNIVEKIRTIESPHADTMSRVLRFQLETGSRISASLRVQVKHLDFNNKTVKFVGDKGNKTRVVTVDPTYMRELQEYVEDKKAGTQVFEFKNSKSYLSITQARKMIERYYNRLAKELNIKGANTHSQRKAYANVRRKYYSTLSTTSLKSDLKLRINIDKTDRTKHRLKRFSRRRGAIKKANRKLSREQMELLLVSLDLGHNRIDVLRYYLSK